MNPRSPRLWPLLLLVLLVAALVSARSHAHEDRPASPHDDHHLHRQQVLADASWHKESQGSAARGASEFDQATALLRKIRPSSSRLTTLTKPTGVLGSTAYYAKELFFLLFMTGPPQRELLSADDQPKKLSQPLAEATKLLETAAAEKNPDAIYLLAEMNFHGNYTHPRDYSEAFRRYQELAALNGNATAQHMLGLMYATGVGGAVEKDQAKAMLYHTFAAENGDIRSQMTIAYRHHTGVATPRDCEEAVYWYKQVADRAVEYMRSGPPGGHIMIKEAYRIADDVGGVYGEGASVSSAGPNAKIGGAASDTHASFDDVLEYLDLMSRKGDLKATFSLGKLHYDGSRELKRDLKAAKSYFLEVARVYWSKDGRENKDIPPGAERLAAKAAGYLGRMFLRGEGIEQSFPIAKTWFQRGVKHADSLSQFSLGIMYLEGLGVEADPLRAADYFAAAADQDLSAAQVRLGALFLDQGDVSTATKYFDLAARNGHFEAFYYLAELANQGVGRDKSCGMAVTYYKIVSEKAESVVSPIREANEAYEAGDLEDALISYMMAAEQGFEAGQANVAYLLDQSRPRLSLDKFLPIAKRKVKLVGDAALALIYWTRSAKQSNIDSMVKMGDYYLDGLGTPDGSDQEKAAACYQAAAETMQSAQAFWNLGWMHENGVGLDQDFHLAKRFYDQALETNREAYLPVRLALLKLRARSWWNTATHGKINSIQDDPEPSKPRSLTEWLTAFLEADVAAYYENMEVDDWEDGTGFGDEYYDEIDESIIDTLVILGLAGILAFLVYYRNQAAERARRLREQQQQQQQQQAQGEIPKSEDLATKYRRYIGQCNRHKTDDLSEFLHDRMTVNGKPRSRIEMQKRLAANIAAASDYTYRIDKLLVNGNDVAVRNIIIATPTADLFGVKPTGKQVEIPQHVFYKFEEGKIRDIWVMFFNYPDPKAVDLPYKSPDAPKNPVVRGLPLYYGASLISSVGFVQNHLWNNTGFNRLRGRPELDDVAPRYDPTVIPIASTSTNLSSEDASATAADQTPRLPPATANGRFHSIHDYHDAYKTGRTTPTAVVEALLPLIRRDVPKPTPHATAWVELREDLILSAAAASTARYAAGKPLGVLDGVPVSVKDEVDLAGYHKRIGTLRDFSHGGRAETSFCVAQWEAAGAVVVGKLTMHELGLDTTNNNPNANHGTPLNPHNPHYYTGGSSGGSGYAVGAGLLPFALGADGGGSIRIPANYCGVYGLKPSHGRVSGRPTPSLAASTGVLGPLAANVADLEVAYRVMATPDALHASSALFAAPSSSTAGAATSSSPSRPKTIGICKPWFSRADPAVRDAVQRCVDHLASTRGYAVVDVALPLLSEGQSAHALTILAEIASGFPDVAGLTPANKVLISVGSRAGAVDLLQAQKVRALLMQHLAALHRRHPGLVVVTPTTPNAGWHIAGGPGDLKYGVSDGNMSIRSMEYVWMANFTGCPALSAPVGYADPVEGEGKIPIGLMGMGEWGSEDALLAFGYDVEEYLNTGLEGGRRRPDAWVDVLKLATEGSK
ncbi:ubiquitin-protein ligase sel1 ubx2 [Neofusicoccum parvum]|nr:ubiquitin-protein ligase sel1 ubx2 [Neofusicoccum parvum]